MTKLRNLIVLSMAIMLFAAVVLNAAPAVNSDQTQKTLEQQIYKEILTMPDYGVFDSIAFELDGDTVILSGKVYTALIKGVAAKRVARIEGVGNVVNNIELLPPSRFDDGIRRRMVRTFANTGGVYRYLIGPQPAMRLVVSNGHVTLEGFVANEGDIRLANILAKSVTGVFSVTNNLKLDDGVKK